MRPAKAANQLTKVWRTLCSGRDPFPVNCRMLAEALGVKVACAAIDDQFEAQLRIRGTLKAIIYNENIREEGRQNFCISHELGHLSCHAGREEFFCTSADLNDMAPHPQNIEQEANLFAATLLMPADDFRAQISRESVSLRRLGELADRRYKTSLTATCRRLIDLFPKTPFGMLVVSDGQIRYWDRTDEMRWTGFGFKSKQIIPQVFQHNDDLETVESRIWLSEKNASKWTLYQSSVHMPYYNQSLILLRAERSGEGSNEQDDEHPESLPLPKFR